MATTKTINKSEAKEAAEDLCLFVGMVRGACVSGRLGNLTLDQVALAARRVRDLARASGLSDQETEAMIYPYTHNQLDSIPTGR